MGRMAMVALAALMLTGTPADAAEYLTNVTSQVYQAQGSKKEIAQRANICIAQILAGGTVDAGAFGASKNPSLPMYNRRRFAALFFVLFQRFSELVQIDCRARAGRWR